jgi:hypothetical protein
MTYFDWSVINSLNLNELFHENAIAGDSELRENTDHFRATIFNVRISFFSPQKKHLDCATVLKK